MIDEKKLIAEMRERQEYWKGKAAEYEEVNREWLSAIADGIATEYTETLLMVENQPKVGEWIPCSERLPENEQEVEITYVKKHWKTGEPLYFTCRAFYTDGTMNTEESDYAWNETDNWEYNENLDAYIIPEGWWESVSFAEEFFSVDVPVIAWQPLPEPYKGESSGAVAGATEEVLRSLKQDGRGC